MAAAGVAGVAGVAGGAAGGRRPEGSVPDALESVRRLILSSRLSGLDPGDFNKRSMDNFLHRYLGEIIADNRKMIIYIHGEDGSAGTLHTIFIDNVTLGRPMQVVRAEDGSEHEEPVMPMQCRLQNTTYGSYVSATITHLIQAVPDPADIRFAVGAPISPNMDYSDLPVLRRKCWTKPIIYLPTMLGSSVCWLSEQPTQLGEDPGDTFGYFIIYGNERVVQPQESIAGNRPLVADIKRGPKGRVLCSEIRSRSHLKEHRSTSTCFVMLRPAPGGTPGDPRNPVQISVEIPFTDKKEIPLALLFRFLGNTNPEQLLRLAFPLETDSVAPERRQEAEEQAACRRVLASALAWESPMFPGVAVWDLSPEQTYQAIGELIDKPGSNERLTRNLNHLRANEFLPHLGLDNSAESLLKKTVYMCKLVLQKLIRVHLKLESPDDRDSMAVKRLLGPGHLLALLLRQLLRRVMRMGRTTILRGFKTGSRRLENVSNMISFDKIGAQLRRVFQSGVWTAESTRVTSMKGVSQIISRQSQTCYRGHMMRVSNPLNKDGRVVQARQLHASQLGLVCPCETPEDDGVGLLKVLTLLTHVRTGHDQKWVLLELLRSGLLQPIGLAPGADWDAWLRGQATRVAAVGNQDGLQEADDEVHVEPRAGDPGRPVAINELQARTWTQEHLDLADLVAAGDGRLVLLDGDIIGTIPARFSTTEFAEAVRQLRRGGDLPKDLSVFARHFGVGITVDSGCMLRPLIRLSELGRLPDITMAHVESVGAMDLLEFALRSRPGEFASEAELADPELVGAYFRYLMENQAFTVGFWDRLLETGVVELVDKEEELDLLVCMDAGRLDDTFTHLEVHGCAMLGLSAAMIPFPDHNQSPRNTYQSMMGKQALGFGILSLAHRMDTQAHSMLYVQQPMASTMVERMVPWLRDEPCGTNVVVAVTTAGAEGLNQEDAIVFKREFLDRGGFRSFYYTKMQASATKGVKEETVIENPRLCKAPVMSTRFGNYDKLDEMGVIEIGETVYKDDVVIGMTRRLTRADGMEHQILTDVSICWEHEEPAIVDRVLLTLDKDGRRTVRVSFRQLRVPMVGDKFAFRCGQKGVIGHIADAVDLPFDMEGIIPDVVINPHCVPSRMTIGLLLEITLGRKGAQLGRRVDASPFQGLDVEAELRGLAELGWSRSGGVLLTDGATGVPFPGEILMGVAFDQRLKHMVDDKVHARSTGPVNMLTRQPNEGRSKMGGPRLGEMERDALIIHGAAGILRNRMLVCSDDAIIPVCKGCGGIGDNMHDRAFGATVRGQLPWCRACEQPCVLVRMPYAFKTFVQECQTMHIKVGMELDDLPLASLLAGDSEHG